MNNAYQQLDNLDKMDKFLQTHNLLKIIEEGIKKYEWTYAK